MHRKILLASLSLVVLPVSLHADAVSDTYYLAGNQLYRQGQYSLSMPFYEAAVKNDPYHWQSYQAKGGTEFHLGNYPQGIADYEQSLRINPNNPALQGYVNQLKSYTLPTPLPQPAMANLYYQAANRLYLEGKYLLAIPYYEAVLKEYPQNAKVYQALGGCHCQLHQVDKAVLDYQKSLEIDPTNQVLAAYLNQLLSQPGVAQAAQNAAAQAAVQAPAPMPASVNNALPSGAPLPTLPSSPAVAVATPTPVTTNGVKLAQSDMAFVAGNGTPVPSSTPILKVTLAPTPLPKEDPRLPRGGSMAFEMGIAATDVSFQDLVTDYLPVTLSAPDQLLLVAEVDLGLDYTFFQNLQAGLQFQYLNKQQEVIYGTYQAFYGGSFHNATSITTWNEAAVGGVIDVKFLLPMDRYLRFMVNGQGGLYAFMDSTEVYQGSFFTTNNLDGLAPGGLIGIGLEWLPDGDGWGLDFGLSYRALTFNPVTYTSASSPSSQTLFNNNGGNATLDFSGPRFNVTARFF